MKDIINRKLYNTNTAKVVAMQYFKNGHILPSPKAEFTYVEILYKTRKGAYFVFKRNDNTSYETITAYDTEEAFDWLYKYKGAYRTLSEFSDVIEEA